MAWEIRNAFLAVFADKGIINCWYHVSTNVEKRLKREVKAEIDFKRIKYDISQLQLSQSEEVFVYGATLFVKKWEKSYPDFTAYFKEQYVDKHNQWFEGVAYCVPSTNVAQESTHGKIKQTFTGNRRVSMSEMAKLCFEIARNWSLDLVNIKPFAIQPDITDQDSIEAYLWKKREIECIAAPCLDDSSDRSWWVPIDDKEKLTMATVRTIEEMRYKKFKGFKEHAFKACKVTIRTPPEDHIMYALGSCRSFFKHMKCVHTLGVSIRLGLQKVPTQIKKSAKQQFEKDIQLPGGRRKPGRTANATPALMIG